MAPFRGFTGNLNKTPTNVNRPNITYTPPKKDKPRGPGSGYTPGGDTYTNYSKKDQEVMFGAAGGKDKFIEMAGNLQQKYPRGLDYQKFLDKSKQYFNALSIGGKEVMGPDGIMRLQMSGADVPMKNAQGQTIMSMMRPELTAQAPTLGQLVGDMGRGIGSMMGAGADFILGGGTVGKVLGGLKDKFAQGTDFMGKVFNPGDIAGKLQAAGPEAQRKYGQLLQQGMTYQQAFEAATGSPFSTNTTATVPMPMTDTPITNNIGSGVKDYLSKVFNPGDVAGRLQSAGPEAQRRYGQFMQQGIPYQQAFEMATGQKFAMGGVANL